MLYFVDFLRETKVLVLTTDKIKSENLDLQRINDRLEFIENTLNFNPENVKRVNLFTQTSKERLTSTKESEEIAKAKDIYASPYVFKRASEILSDWWNYIGFNYIKECNYDSRMLVEFGFMIKKGASIESDNPVTSEKKNKMKFERLTKMGFAIEEIDSLGYHLMATETNVNLLNNLFANYLNSKIFDIKIKNFKNKMFIDKVSVFVNLESLESLPCKYKEDEIKIEKTEYLNADQKTKISKDLTEMISCCSFLSYSYKNKDTESTDMALSTLEYLFSSICDCAGVETSISKKIKESHIEERKMNQEIEKIKNDIACVFPIKDLKKNMEELTTTISKNLYKKYRLKVKNFKIDRYGYTSLDLYFDEHDRFYGYYLELEDDEKIIEMEELKNIFDFYEVNGSYLIKNKSKEALIEIIKKEFPNSEIKEILTAYNRGEEYIRHISIVLYSLNNINS